MLSDKLIEELSSLAATDKTEFVSLLKNESDEFKSDEEIAETFKSVFSKRFNKIVEDTKGEVSRKTKAEFERELKKAVGYDGTEKGNDLFKAIAENSKGRVEFKEVIVEKIVEKNDFSKLTDKDWAQNEYFQKALTARGEQTLKELEILKKEYSEFKERETTEQHQKRVHAYMTNKLYKMNPKGLENEVSKDEVLGVFLEKKIDPKKVRFDLTGEAEFLDDDGNRIVDLVYGKPLTAEDLLKTQWWYGFKAVPDMTQPPAPNGGNGQGNGTIDAKTKNDIDDLFRKKGDIVGYLSDPKLHADKRKAGLQYFKTLTS